MAEHSSDVNPFIAAIDGGGTKTECLISDIDGTIRGHGLGGPVNVSFVSLSEAHESLRTAIASATGGRCIEVAVVSLAATTPESVARPIIDAWLDYEWFINPREDGACLASATADYHGAVVLAGTGCFQWARNSEGDTHRTDGWGALVGDQGSAYDIVRRALVACGRAVDGRGPNTTLVEQFCSHFGVPTLRHVTRRIHAEPMPRHEIAALAPLVSAFADTDPVARQILHDAARCLADGMVTCIERVGLAKSDFTVALCGGVFNAGIHVIAPIERELKRIAPRANAVQPSVPPVVGALFLAAQAVNSDSGHQLLRQMTRDYKRITTQER